MGASLSVFWITRCMHMFCYITGFFRRVSQLSFTTTILRGARRPWRLPVSILRRRHYIGRQYPAVLRVRMTSALMITTTINGRHRPRQCHSTSEGLILLLGPHHPSRLLHAQKFLGFLVCSLLLLATPFSLLLNLCPTSSQTLRKLALVYSLCLWDRPLRCLQ